MKRNKTLKVILTITLVMLLSMIGIQVNASTINDENNNIDFPMIVTNGSGSLTVKDGSAVYYQAVEVSDETYNKLVSLNDEAKEKTDALWKETNALDDEADKLYDESEALYKEYEELNNKYKENLADYNAMEEGEEKEKYNEETVVPSKTIADTKLEEYNTKFDEYEAKYAEATAKYNEYKTKFDEYQAQIKSVRESIEYDDTKWTQTTDNTFTVDIDTYTGVKNFAIWAKVDTAQGTVYDMAIYKVSGTYEEEKPEENPQPEQPTQPEEQPAQPEENPQPEQPPVAEQVVNQEQPTQEQPTQQTETNNAGQTTNTKSSQVTTKNPKTGDHIGIAFAVLAFVVIGNLVLTIRNRKTEK